jgi:uncharacterized membrane protein YbhN (UPF0104 family)
LLVGVVKLTLAAGILGYIFYGLSRDGAFRRLVEEPKHWGFLAAAQALVIAAIVNNIVRWFVLVRALDLPFQLPDALRLGAVGFLLNQVSLGSVGGDLFKAVFIAREQPGQRTEAVASVLVDRVVGMYAMMLVATCGRFVLGDSLPAGLVARLADVVTVFTVVGTIGIALLMTPLLAGPKIREWAGRLPLVGGTAARLLGAADAYRSERRYLFAGIAMSCLSHLLFASAFWLVSQGLPVHGPSFVEMLVISPLCMCAGAVPLTPSGLGVAEGAMGVLFQGFGYSRADGLMVGIAFRAMTYVMAVLGAVYWFSASRKLRAALAEAEQLADEPPGE